MMNVDLVLCFPTCLFVIELDYIVPLERLFEA